MRTTKTTAFRSAPSSFWVVVSEDDSRYTRLAAVRMTCWLSEEDGEERVYTIRTTRNMQMDTGDITPMISTPIVSRMLPPSIFGSPAGGEVWDGEFF